jgi:hypothetical protein
MGVFLARVLGPDVPAEDLRILSRQRVTDNALGRAVTAIYRKTCGVGTETDRCLTTT